MPGADFASDADRIHGYSGWHEDIEATRYLSARTLLSIRFAKDVFERVVNERFRALAPSYGVDIVAVAKWALKSLRLRVRRDDALAATVAVGLALAVVGLFTWLWASLVSVIAALIVGWLIVFWELELRVSCVCKHMLRGHFYPRDAPDPLRQQERDRLNLVSERRAGNLVVFQNHDAFVGSGQRLSREHLVIDVSRGRRRRGKDNKVRVKPQKFTNEDVHLAILGAMRKLGLRDLKVEERLFINGRHVQGNSALLPKLKEPPVTSVDCALLKQSAIHPTPDARVYVCVEMPSWQGQLVVTMFARAVHVGGSLYIEWRFHVLPPVKRVFQEIDNGWLESPSRRRWRLMRIAIPLTPRALCFAPVHIVASLLEAHRWRRAAKRQAQSIDLGQAFDYGALRSMREEASGATRQHYFLRRDETMFVLLAQEKLIRAIRRFLIRMNVDTGQLAAQIEVIVKETHQHYSLHVGGNIKDSNISVGDKAQASTGPKTSATRGKE